MLSIVLQKGLGIISATALCKQPSSGTLCSQQPQTIASNSTQRPCHGMRKIKLLEQIKSLWLITTLLIRSFNNSPLFIKHQTLLKHLGKSGEEDRVLTKLTLLLALQISDK